MNLTVDLILAPIFTLFIVQSIKLASDGIKGNFNLKNVLTAYGGMPSSHSAVVATLTAMVGYREGVASTAFGIALLFSLIVITDAMVLRKYIDLQGSAIRTIAASLPPAVQTRLNLPAKRLQHTFFQVVVGTLIGVAIASLVHFL
ncbi:MAG: divergent PAP2 family protein [Patescibacteria group bacterium]|nr:divergent PAP2 family protein [Patescibacteria group bacterium]MDD5715255.1 divergent PAP2 family protein [Patescibacteria group bacterium]